MNRIVLFADTYQENHKLFYLNLISKFSNDSHIDLIICNNIELDEKEFNNTSLHIKKNKETVSSFIKTKKKIIDRSDLIIFEELYSFHLSILILLITNKHKSLQIIHNANKFLKRVLSFNIKSAIAYIFFKIVKKNIKGVVVISLTVKEYIINNNLFNSNVFYIPFNDTTDECNIVKDHSDIVKFTIPGTVNTERRNYKIFLKVFLRILQEKPQLNIKLCLLGKVVKIDREEQELIDKIKQTKYNALSLWEEFIDRETYHKELITSQFLIGNINVNYTENNIREVYGQSKETGVLFLMLQYKVPTLFPENYSYSEIYKSYIINYKNEEDKLYETFLNLINLKGNLYDVDLKVHDNYVKGEIISIYNNFLSS